MPTLRVTRRKVLQCAALGSAQFALPGILLGSFARRSAAEMVKAFGVSEGLSDIRPRFEVVSIRPTTPDNKTPKFIPSPDRFTVRAETARNLIYFAYDIKYGYNKGGGKWVDSDRFDIDAKIDDATAQAFSNMNGRERMAQLRLMVQGLLQDRFSLVIQKQTKNMPVYALVVSKDGSKLQDAEKAAHGGWTVASSKGITKITAKDAGLNGLVQYLMQQPAIGRQVIDETRLSGAYNYELEWTSDPNSSDSTQPNIFTALQEQLGLKLEPRVGPVQTVMVEHIDRPSEN